eukprot:5765379-Amphidinium_carterae.1
MPRKGAITRGSFLVIKGGGYQWAGIYVARTEQRFHVILPAAAAYLHEHHATAEGVPDASGELMLDVIGVCVSRSLVRSLELHPGYQADPAGFWLDESRVPFILSEDGDDGVAWPSVNEAIALLGMPDEEEEFQEPADEEDFEPEPVEPVNVVPKAAINLAAGRGR